MLRVQAQCAVCRVSTRSGWGGEKRAIVTDLRCGAVGRAGLLFRRKRTAYEHEIIVDRAAFIAADKLTMEPIQVAANATITCRLEHMTDADRANDRAARWLQSAFAHG